MRRALLLLCCGPFFAAAQWLSVGVTGGVPLSPHTQTSPDACFPTQPAVCGPNDLYSKSYLVGPSADIYLPWRLSIGTAALYQRFHQDLTTGLVVQKGGGASFGGRSGLAAGSWMFPLLVKYNLSSRRLRPFVGVGATLRHLGVFEGHGYSLDIHLQPQPQQPVRFDPDKPVDVAVTASAGLHYGIAGFDLSPELRYLHWTSTYFQPVQDQLMLLLNIRFPRQR